MVDVYIYIYLSHFPQKEKSDDPLKRNIENTHKQTHTHTQMRILYVNIYMYHPGTIQPQKKTNKENNTF